MQGAYLLIGSGSSISKLVAQRLSSEKKEVIKVSRSSEVENGHFNMDVTDSASNFAQIDAPLAGLIYFPGTINLKPFKSLTDDDYRRDWEINFFGATRSIRHYLPQLNRCHASSIVLISTVAVQQGMAYHASIAGAKGAIEGLTRSLAAEFAPKIRVNAVAPSLTSTPLAKHLLNNEKRREHACQRHPLQRVGNPEDIAEAICFLVSEKSSWMTGQVIHVDGGLSSIKLL